MTAVAMTAAFQIAKLNIEQDESVATQAALNTTTASMLPDIQTYQPTVTAKSKNETLIPKVEEEVPCDFKKNIFQQLNYIVGRNTSCVYR